MTHATANGITVEYDISGPENGEPLLLIMGLGAQMTRWPPAFVDALAGRGMKVIRFDNRDIGLSSKIEAAGAPDMAAVGRAIAEGRKPDVAYTLAEMAADYHRERAVLKDQLAECNRRVVAARRQPKALEATRNP